MKHGSLFSGIGGIDLGFRWSGIETVWQVEIDSWCRKVLAKNFPEVKEIHRLEDVKNCDRSNLESVDIISGGFPCQDISVGGRRRGITTETRSGLWFEFKRIIKELQPTWVFIENVAALRDKGADIVFTDLEELDYSFGSIVVGADILGAPHQRRRVFIVGCKYPLSNLYHRTRVAEMEGRRFENCSGFGEGFLRDQAGIFPLSPTQIGALEQNRQDWNNWKHQLGTRNVCAGDSAYSDCRRAVNGFSDWVDRIGGIGNAVVPAIPMLIGHWIKGIHSLEGFDMGRPKGSKNRVKEGIELITPEVSTPAPDAPIDILPPIKLRLEEVEQDRKLLYKIHSLLQEYLF